MALDFSAFWLYRTSGGEGRETQSEFQERYSLGVGPQLDWRPTHAITATAAVGYNRTQRDTGSGTKSTDEITPSASLILSNDIFSLGLAGSASQTSGSDQEKNTTNSWDATLASRWNIPFWPNLQLNYGQRDDGGGSDDLFSRSDRIQTSSSASVNWDLLLARLNYRYSVTLDEDRDLGLEVESKSHFAKIETDGRLFNNRVSYNLAQQVQDTSSTISGSLDEEGFLTFPLGGIFAVKRGTLSDDPVGDLFYQSPSEAPEALPVEIDPIFAAQNSLQVSFAVSDDFDRRVNRLRLTFDAVGLDGVEGVLWDLYRRDFSGWVAVAVNLSGQRDGNNNLDISIPETGGAADEEILLIARDAPTFPVTLTVVEAFGREQVEEGSSLDSSSRSYLTTAGLRIALTQSLSLSTNVTYELFERGETENSRRTLSGRLRWSPFTWLSPSLSYSESREDREGQDEQLNRTYGLTVATVPLPTMNVTFGVSQNERFDGDLKTNESLRYTISSAAQIYPDLNASLFLTWQDAEVVSNRAELDAEETDRAEYDESATFSSRLNLNARLTRALIADLTTNYRESEREDDTRQTADSTLTLQYRPSALLLVRGFYTTYLLDSLQDDSMGAGLTLALLRTSKTRVNLDYNMAYSDQLSQRVGVNGSWNLSRALSLQTRTNYTFAETDFYSAQVSLNLRL